MLFTGVTNQRGEGIGHDLGEVTRLLFDVCDVAVGPGQVDALGAAVVRVRGDRWVVDRSTELAGRGLRVEDTRHPHAVMDLQELVAQQVAGLTIAGQDAAGELPAGCGDPVAVGVGGGTADMLSLGECLFVFRQVLQAVEPVLEGVFVGETRLVGAFA